MAAILTHKKDSLKAILANIGTEKNPTILVDADEFRNFIMSNCNNFTAHDAISVEAWLDQLEYPEAIYVDRFWNAYVLSGDPDADKFSLELGIRLPVPHAENNGVFPITIVIGTDKNNKAEDDPVQYMLNMLFPVGRDMIDKG